MLRRTLSPTAELVPLGVGDTREFAEHMDRAREHIRPWVGPSFVTDSEDGARRTLSRYAATAVEDGGRLLGIRLDGMLVGGVMFVSFSAASGQCEVGCWLEPAAEGHGLVTAAASALLDYAFRDRGLHRAEWRCRADNVRSSAVASRLGMTLEGTLRGSWRYDGAFYDSQVWGVLRDEYLARTVV